MQAAPAVAAAAQDDATEEVKEEDIKKLDMDLGDDEPTKTSVFTDDDDKPTKNIWNYDDEADTPAFLRRRKRDEDEV